MTTYNKSTLKTFFETNDVPQGSDYANLIDSQVNIVESSLQTMGGPLGATEIITPRVSATNVIVTSILSAANITSDNINVVNLNSTNSFSSVISANSINVSTVSANIVFADTARVSAAIINNATFNNISGSAATFSGPVTYSTNIVSAAGITQTTAALLGNVVNRGKGVVDGVSTGFVPPSNQTGTVRYLYNEGVSANLWPPVGGTINGLAVNAPLSLAASSMVTIVHLTASAMAAK